MPLYPGDWFSDYQLARCSPATRGVWIDFLLAMHTDYRSGMVTGTLEELAKVGRCTEPEMSHALDELARTGTAMVIDHSYEIEHGGAVARSVDNCVEQLILAPLFPRKIPAVRQTVQFFPITFTVVNRRMFKDRILKEIEAIRKAKGRAK